MKLQSTFERILNYIPWGVEMDFFLFRRFKRGLPDRYGFRCLPEVMNEFTADAISAKKNKKVGKRVFIFSTIHYWLEHTTLMGLALAGQGYQVTLAHLPYADWYTPVNLFTLRRRILYIRQLFKPAHKILKLVLLPISPRPELLPEEIQKEIEHISFLDSQYTLQAEAIDLNEPIYQLRLKRNQAVAYATFAFLNANRPDAIIIPSGSILEFGIVFAVASHLGVRTITYEFSEKSESLWLAQDAQIMRHEIDALWGARKDIPLDDDKRARLNNYLASRQTTQKTDSLALVVQEAPKQGTAVRGVLGLDNRPIVLIPTNVLGDALTLDRQLFSKSMTEWCLRTLDYFTKHPEVQVVVRIHPGESLVKGPSISRFIDQEFPSLPEHVHLVKAKEKINTYDLMDIADLGLVYTTTAGLEMSIRGIPVITGGKTHYRGRGFTIDVDTWEEYFSALNGMLPNLPAHRLTQRQRDLTWNYAYRFFLEFPRPYPWHLYKMKEDAQQHPLKEVISREGLDHYGNTFRYLAGEPLDWRTIDA